MISADPDPDIHEANNQQLPSDLRLETLKFRFVVAIDIAGRSLRAKEMQYSGSWLTGVINCSVV